MAAYISGTGVLDTTSRKCRQPSSQTSTLSPGRPALGASRSPSTSTSVDLPTAHPQSYIHAGSLSSPDASLSTGPRALGDSRSASTSTGVDLPTAHPQSYTHAGSLSSPDASLFTGPRALGDSRSPSTSTGVDLPTGHPQSYIHAGSLSSPDASLSTGPRALGDSRSPSTSTGVDLPTAHPQSYTHAGSLSSRDASPRLTTSTDVELPMETVGWLVNPNPDFSDQSMSRKRTQRSSPVPSPSKQTRSPAPKLRRRLRTGTEQRQSADVPEVLSHPLVNRSTANSQRDLIRSKSLSDFETSHEEALMLKELKEELNTYMIIKSFVSNKRPQRMFQSMQEYFSVTRATHTEKSSVLYLEVMDAVADSKDTMMVVLHNLYQKIVEAHGLHYLAVEGDAKLFDILQSLKHEYGDELKWLVPFPGDWHALKNYQPALMKAYYDAGLKDMARAAGYPVAQIQSCGQFKRVHQFILEAWEAIYRAMLAKFLEEHSSDTHTANTTDQLQDLVMESLEATPVQSGSDFRKTFNRKLVQVNAVESISYTEFHQFLKSMADQDDTWRFWVQFILEDAMAYMGLFLALRSGDWHLRMASLKLMAPVFTAFDHPNYQKLISQHLGDVLCMPSALVTAFQQGAFVVSISGKNWHSVAIDEAHEMLINKECKTSITRPTPDYISRLAHYLPYRSKAVENARTQLFPETKPKESIISSPFSSDSNTKKFEQNVLAILDTITSKSLLEIPSGNRGLFNPFSGKQATTQQTHDLLQFRRIGQGEFLLRIAYFILKQPSVEAPNRRRRMQTFSERQVKTRRVSQLEKDKKLVLAAIKRKMQFSKRTGKPIDRPGEQLLQLPLSMCDNDGNPLKGQKSYTTKALQARYKTSSPPVFATEIPSGWRPQCVLIEGMFLINTTPLGSHKMLAHYANFLLRRHAISQFNRGSDEVHIIFDTPGRLANTPKYFEQKRRDVVAKVPLEHYCDDFQGSTKIQHGKWRENFLNCRECKRKLVLFIGRYFLNNAGTYLQPHHTLYVAGAFEGAIVDTAWFVRGNSKSQPHPAFTCNAEETDTRIWLHATQTVSNQILILSPDTDVYHIGLPLPCVMHKNIIVQVSTFNSRQLSLLNLTALVQAFRNDPDLAHIDPSILPKLFQVLYVTSGCDYISFFSQLGKASFLRYFFQYSSFISCGNEHPGTLADTGLAHEQGYLAFIRMIGTLYFKKHSTGFETPSPASHFLTFCDPNLTALQQHSVWLDDIRQNIWYRVKFENEMIPSDEALRLHWRRTCWVVDMWSQATRNTMILEPITDHGWTVQNNQLSVVWDSQQNMAAIRERVNSLLKGCKCVTGCVTRRCSCQKNQTKWSVGCECTNCCNIDQEGEDTANNEISDIAIDEEVNINRWQDEGVEDIMDWVFGDEADHGEDAQAELAGDIDNELSD